MEQQAVLKAVLFDFDGTLVHLGVNWDYLRAWLRGFFLPFGFDSPFRPLLASLQEAETHLSVTAGATKAAELMARAREFCRLEEVRAAKYSEWLPGAPETLAWLTGHGIPFGVVSNNHSHAVHATFALLGYEGNTAIIGRDSVRRSKPDPEGARRLLAELRGNAPNAWMVGDTLHDVQVGMALGIHTVLVRSPNTPPGLDPTRFSGLVAIARLDEIIPHLEDGD